MHNPFTSRLTGEIYKFEGLTGLGSKFMNFKERDVISVRNLSTSIALIALLLSACARDNEASLRAQLDQWFYLGSTSYFVSKRDCTGAMFSVKIGKPRKTIALYDNVNNANFAFLNKTVVAVQVTDLSPAAVIDDMLQSGTSSFGRKALAAASLAGACFEDKGIAGNAYEAMKRTGAILAFDRESRGLMILDPAVDRLFFIRSDVW